MATNPLGLRVFTVPPDVPWTELNRRYFAFATSLPSPLNELAHDCYVFRGKGEAIAFHSLAELHPLVTCIPWLFDEGFPEVSNVDILEIAEAGVYLFSGMLLYDAYQDNQLSNFTSIPLLHQQLTMAALRKLSGLFNDSSPFWSYFDKYFKEYAQALVLEKEHWGQVETYPVELMYRIGSGKVALLKTVTTALALKGGQEKQIEKLETAMDFLTAAMQLSDDIVDWKEDYLNKNYTLPLTQAIPVADWPAPSLSVEEIGHQFDQSIILESLIVKVVEWFHRALDVVIELNCPDWVAFVESCLIMTKKYQEASVARKVLRTLDAYPAFQHLQDRNLDKG